MKLQAVSKTCAAVVFATFAVAFTPIRSVSVSVAAQEHQDHNAVTLTLEEVQEEQQRAAAKAAHEAEEDQQRAAKAAQQADEEQQEAIAHAAHEAEEQQRQASKAASEVGEHMPAMEVTVVGCVVREKDYRKQHHKGNGGPLATGIGIGNEYVLVNATRLMSDVPPPDKNSCSPDSWGQAFELTGGGEGRVKPFVGHWVEITGKQKKAEITKATRGTANPKPTGGGGPMWQDLKIFEINVYSVRDYVPPMAAVAPPRFEPQAAAVIEPPAAVPETEPEPIATTGRETLPKTASPMPLVALVGAFFVAVAVALRAFRGMTGRTEL